MAEGGKAGGWAALLMVHKYIYIYILTVLVFFLKLACFVQILDTYNFYSRHTEMYIGH
jgi:hypothetical protein